MLNHFEGKKEFIYKIHCDGELLCESLLFLNVKYPVNAVAIYNGKIIKVLRCTLCNYWKIINIF